MVAIIDDREDVWGRCPNLVHVKPYVFFSGTSDINAPPPLVPTPSHPSSLPATPTTPRPFFGGAGREGGVVPQGQPRPFKMRHIVRRPQPPSNLAAHGTTADRNGGTTLKLQHINKETTIPTKKSQKEEPSASGDFKLGNSVSVSPGASVSGEQGGGRNPEKYRLENESDGVGGAAGLNSNSNNNNGEEGVESGGESGDEEGGGEVGAGSDGDGRVENGGGGGREREGSSSSSSGSSSESEDSSSSGSSSAMEDSQTTQESTSRPTRKGKVTPDSREETLPTSLTGSIGDDTKGGCIIYVTTITSLLDLCYHYCL